MVSLKESEARVITARIALTRAKAEYAAAKADAAQVKAARYATVRAAQLRYATAKHLYAQACGAPDRLADAGVARFFEAKAELETSQAAASETLAEYMAGR